MEEGNTNNLSKISEDSDSEETCSGAAQTDSIPVKLTLPGLRESNTIGDFSDSLDNASESEENSEESTSPTNRLNNECHINLPDAATSVRFCTENTLTQSQDHVESNLNNTN